MEIGLAVVQSMDIRTVARDILVELAATTHETTHLAQLEDTHVRFLRRERSGAAGGQPHWAAPCRRTPPA
jgi:DNA-binding IclR family transcriptional regulator